MEVQVIQEPPVPQPPAQVVVTLSREEAAYVAALLGLGNSYATCQNAGVDYIESPYFPLHDAVEQLGAKGLCEKLERGHTKWLNR